MSRILVIVEGKSDEGVVEGLAKRIGVSVSTRKMRGNKIEKAGRIVRAEMRTGRYGKAIILKDLHGAPEEEVKRELERMERRLRGYEVHSVLVRRSIETWILAGLGFEDPEGVEDPSSTLREHVKTRFGKTYVKTYGVARELMEMADLEKARKKAKSLDEFLERLKDPP